MNREQLLKAFPKQRPPLTPKLREIYENHCKDNRQGRGVVGQATLKLEAWMHRQVAAEPQSYPVLEIGAGTFNHLPYESLSGPYDAIEPFSNLFTDGLNLNSVRKIYTDIEEVPSENRYERIISIAVLEHLTNLPSVIARSALLLSDGGEFRSGIPSEGGLLWYLAWRWGSGAAFWLRHRLSYKPLMKHEHINTADEILDIIRLFYNDVEFRRFPIAVKNLSLYTFIKARAPKHEDARRFLERTQSV